ncbi:MAG: thymidylate synthase [Lactobacillus iners]|nr:thymidylate synthase [Lactobacillus iners]
MNKVDVFNKSLCKLLEEILYKGERTFLYGYDTVPIISLGRKMFEFNAKSTDFLFVSTYEKNFTLADTLYVLSGRNDSKYLTYFKPIFKMFGPVDGFFENSLGKRLYEIHGNQLNLAVQRIKKNPYDAKAIVFLNGNEPQLIDCTLTFQLSSHDGKNLDLIANYRANDVLEYVVHDSFLLSTILNYCALKTNLSPGKVIFLSERMYIKKSEEKIAQNYKEKLNKYKENTLSPKCNIGKLSIAGLRKESSNLVDIISAYNSKWINKNKALELVSANPRVATFLPISRELIKSKKNNNSAFAIEYE